jgi:hypothetical protein
VCAITEKLDLAAREFDAVDFSDITVMDESQPGAIDRVRMEDPWGQVFWVAGNDGRVSELMTCDRY